MKQYVLPFGKEHIRFALPSSYRATEFIPRNFPPLQPTGQAVAHQINYFLRRNAWIMGARRAKIAIAINDQTRPAIQYEIAPILVHILEQRCIDICHIRFYIANGLHAPCHPSRYTELLPPALLRRYRIINHSADQESRCIYLGRTSYGTPIFINRQFAHADVKIVIASIEAHQFVGVSGGAKTAVIGLGGRQTITHNHAMCVLRNAQLGKITDNPVRNDIEQIGAKLKIDMQINVVLNLQQSISDIHIFDAHNRNHVTTFSETARQLTVHRALPYSKQYDCVITAAGGFPRDGNLYQLQKALAHVVTIAKKNAPIILCGACADGIGSQQFADHFMAADSISDVLIRFQSVPFTIGPHKSYLFARDMEQHPVALCSTLPREQVEKMHFSAISIGEQALERHIAQLRLDAHADIAIVPFANNTHFVSRARINATT